MRAQKDLRRLRALPAAAMPAPPGHLSPDARAFWVPICDYFSRTNRPVTAPYGLALEGLCEAYSALRRYLQTLSERGGKTYQTATANGRLRTRQYPEVAMAANAERQFRSWLAQFNVRPIERSSIVSAVKRLAAAKTWPPKAGEVRRELEAAERQFRQARTPR